MNNSKPFEFENSMHEEAVYNLSSAFGIKFVLINGRIYDVQSFDAANNVDADHKLTGKDVTQILSSSSTIIANIARGDKSALNIYESAKEKVLTRRLSFHKNFIYISIDG